MQEVLFSFGPLWFGSIRPRKSGTTKPPPSNIEFLPSHAHCTTLMLLTRSLPPQFLLPAWSARQLAGFTQKQRRQKQQRASKSDDTKLIWGDKPTRLHSKTPRPQNPSALSLFDELFPEEKGRREEAAEGQDQFGRLPAFVLKKRVAAAELKSKEERRKREEEVKNPKPLAFDGLRAKADWSLSEEQAERSERTGASVLVLNSAMKTLEESDFFRMSPKGEHIEGWTGGILKGMLCISPFTCTRFPTNFGNSDTRQRQSHPPTPRTLFYFVLE